MGHQNLLADDALVLKASAAVTSSAAGSLILDLGEGYTGGLIYIDVTAIDIASNDEIYDIVPQLSPDAAFGTAGNIVDLPGLNLSAKEVKRTDCDRDDTTGEYVLAFSNLLNGTKYRYLRLYTVVGGTTATITYSARATWRAA